MSIFGESSSSRLEVSTASGVVVLKCNVSGTNIKRAVPRIRQTMPIIIGSHSDVSIRKDESEGATISAIRAPAPPKRKTVDLGDG